MTFSDEDLKQLKTELQTPEYTTRQRRILPALLHRLECAEDTIRELQQCIKCKCDPWPCLAIKESLQAWRTSAGKDPTND